MPLLGDTIDHIFRSLDSLARHTSSKIDHAAPAASKLKLDALTFGNNGNRGNNRGNINASDGSLLRLDWKEPAMSVASALMLLDDDNRDSDDDEDRDNNRNGLIVKQSDRNMGIFSNDPLSLQQGNDKYDRNGSNINKVNWNDLDKEDLKYVKAKMKQTWQYQCIQQYMQVLFSIVDALARKQIENPEIEDNEETRQFEGFIKNVDVPVLDTDGIMKELTDYVDLLSGNDKDDKDYQRLMNPSKFEKKEPDIDDIENMTDEEKKFAKFLLNKNKNKNENDDTMESKFDDEKDPFWRKPPDMASTEHSTVEQILHRCIYFLTSNVVQTRYVTLSIIEKCIFILSFRKKVLLPNVHDIWQNFQSLLRFGNGHGNSGSSGSNASIVLKTFDVLLVICQHCGNFIQKRLRNSIWPSMKLHFKSNFQLIDKRLSDLNLESKLEVKIIHRMLDCLVALLMDNEDTNTDSGINQSKLNEINAKIQIRNKSTKQAIFRFFCNDVVKTFLPLLNERKCPIASLNGKAVKLFVLLAKIVDLNCVLFQLFVLVPQLMGKYYESHYQQIIMNKKKYIEQMANDQDTMVIVSTMEPLHFATFFEKECGVKDHMIKNELPYHKHALKILQCIY